MRKMAERLHVKALEIAKDYRKLEADLLDILIQMEKTKVFKTLGYPSLFQYATQALKLADASAYNFITVARKSLEVPELKKQIILGNLSVSQARRVAPVLNKTNQNQWIPKAITLPQKKLEKVVAEANPKLAVPERAKYVAKERLSLNIGVSEKAFEKLKKLQDLVSQNRKQSCSLEETLNELMDFYESHKDPLEKAKRVISKPIRRQATPDSPQVRRRLSDSLKHQVNLRDRRKCNFKDKLGNICGRSRFLDIHHLKPLSEGGTHELNNLITVCKFHHQALHGRFG